MRLAGLLTILLFLAAPSPGADDFRVVVHPSVAGTSIRRVDLAAIFLGKASRWGGGGLAVPVDQSGTSRVRRAFSEAVLGMPVPTVVQYWQKLMFGASPVRPPAVKGSDAEVLAFVAKTAGSVGYVSKEAALPPGVKAVAVVD
jgi:ABC-type phosphate transport system substrate-binding protein